MPRAARNGAKRFFDFTAVVVTAPIWGPVMLALAGLIRLTSKGAAFYGHERVGRGGRTIRCFKLRTMVADAESRLAQLLSSDPALAEEFARTFKLRDDPRVTRIGRFLRKTSLDELPQLINVLKGEMSIVGPRPITEDEIRRYGQVGRGGQIERQRQIGRDQVNRRRRKIGRDNEIRGGGEVGRLDEIGRRGVRERAIAAGRGLVAAGR